jgi:hypothetical protein
MLYLTVYLIFTFNHLTNILDGSEAVNRTLPPEKTPTQTRDIQRRTSLQEMRFGGGNCPPHPL